jgi:Ner family transcriptional regulator
MNHERIKYQLKLKGSSLAAIALELKISRSVVSRVSAGKTKSARVQEAIANKLGCSAAKIWPKKPQKKSPLAS